MSYVHDSRVIHDADAHILETPDWFEGFAEERIVSRLREMLEPYCGEEVSQCRAMHADPEYRARDSEELMTRKNWRATGSFLAEDRAGALDLLGFSTQLIFPTVSVGYLAALEHRDDMDLLYGTAAASNRAMSAFCSGDSRLLAVGYVPLADLERVPGAAEQAIESGCRALLIPSRCPRNHATSHAALDALWARAQEAGLPILFHVGNPDELLTDAHKNNGAPPVPDFHGGSENFTSVSYMAIPAQPSLALSMMLLDGVLERFPELRVGVIELGASWVPGLMRQLDSAVDAFSRMEDRLRTLSLRPSEYIRRQVRVTPFPAEDAGWIMEQTGPEVCLFSSDYPHVEGGRNPLGRFERSMGRLPVESQERFYRLNFEDLMGCSFGAVSEIT
ncbi:MAG: amidohydrolase family protein [Myxococcota bacterium]|nr:amidohydrolase family protein [Myxococcota bacterium]